MSGAIDFNPIDEAIPVFADNVIKMLQREYPELGVHIHKVSGAIQQYAKDYVTQGQIRGYP